ncbi:MAG: hypothetical protein WCK00_09590, partial [Deltaproteobacteria bacterium]
LNYRRAKEWLKELCKRNKDLYQPRLIACYQGLARQMLEKGQLPEAKTVFEQIRLLTGRPVDGRLEAQSLTLADDYSAAASAMVRRYGEEGGNTLTAAEEKSMADALVIAFEEIPELQGNHPDLCRESLAVRTAMDHLGAGRFAEAQNELKVIGRRSIFADWRLFIKGLCAFYAGDDPKALEALHNFDRDSLLFRAARPFIHIIDEGAAPLSKDEAKEPLLADICRILHRPELAPVLPRAEYLWRMGRHADSFDHVSRMLGDFPTNEPGLLRTLSRFYFQALFHMSPSLGDKYFRDLHYLLKKRPNNDVANLLYTRSRNLFIESDQDFSDPDLLRLWEAFLTDHQCVAGESSRLRALVYAHLGDLFGETLLDMDDDDDDFYGPWSDHREKQGETRNFQLAEEAYEKSLALYPADKDIHLKLLSLYEKDDVNTKRNKKLDEISRLFPDDKDVLAKNGNYCIERKAYIKGIEYLKRAVALDPLARINRETLVLAYIKASLHFARQKKSERFREFMKEAAEMGEADLMNMTLGRPYLQIRQAIFEWIGGCEKEGNLLLADAMKNGNEDGRLSYFAYLISKACEAPLPLISRLENTVKAIFAAPTPAGAAILTDVFTYVRPIIPNERWLNKESMRLRACAMKAADQPCTPGDAEKIIRCAFDEPLPDWHLIQRYIKKMLKLDPKSPLFLYFQYLRDKDLHRFQRPPAEKDLQRLRDIQAIAVERNERLLINLLSKEIRRIEGFLSSSMDDDYDFDEDDENDSDNGHKTINFHKLAEELIEEMGGVFNPRGKSSSRRKKKNTATSQTSFFDDSDCPF